MSDNKLKPLNGADTAWLRMDSPTNLMIINAMLITENMDFEDFKNIVASRFLRFPRFKAHPVNKSGQFYWQEDQYFDLDNHVRKVALTGDGDKQDLQSYLADQASIPMDASKPLWQILFVENFQQGNAIILRVHHSYADGLALISVFHSITDSDPDVMPFSPSSADNDEQVSDPLDETKDINYEWPRYQKVLDTAKDRAESYASFAKKISASGFKVLNDKDALKELVGDSVKAAAELAQLAAMQPDPKRVLKGKLGVRKTCAWSDPISFDSFHGISKVLGCKINDLLLSCVAGAFREELLLAGEELQGREIHVTLPVNIRSADKMDMGGNPEELGNCFGTVFVSLPVGIDNPIERVYKIKHDMLALKQSLQPALSFGILYVAGMLPKNVQKTLLESFGNKTSAVLSNVPGAREKRYIAGAEIKEQMFWVPQTGDIGLGLSIISYAGQIQFGLMGDAKLFPNPERIVKHFVDQLEKHRVDIVSSYIDDLVQPVLAS
jgi:WS/DGAT/MGAT family acyltransferase